MASGGMSPASGAPTTRETFSGAGNGIANGDFENLPWTRVSGSVLVSLTDPLLPTIVTAGVYAVTVVAAVASMTVGGSWIGNLDLDFDGADQGVVAQSSLSDTVNGGGPRISLSLTYYIPADGVVSFVASNFDGVTTRVFNIIGAYIQRLG